MRSKGALRIFRGALFAFAVASCAPATSAGRPGEPGSKEASSLELFQQREDRLFTTGYRLVTANARYCERQSLASGLLLHDAESYGDPAAVRRLFGLSGDIGVQSVASGSPAERVGLKQNDTLVAFADAGIEDNFPPTRPGWKRLTQLREQFDQSLSTGQLRLVWRDTDGNERTDAISGVPACTSRFELLDEARAAEADGERVMLGQNFPAFGYSEDEFAAAVAHELAHNLLAHVATLDRLGRTQSNIRLSERDADRLMPWLLHNAGYDPRAAVSFMRRWGPRYGGGLLRKRTHDGWDERVEFIEAEIALLDARIRNHGDADWRTGFSPMLGAGSSQ
ncbi:hypothetical protein [Qipengyuania soli]|uniref:PDZ domain-containing protein n=1 Tax=Qipengyuania soli TaxID=2782568 RepID=A0A7S8F4H4_9SPHN|nr:hypothetical protein [Qipengyuania soli]QPD00296.1 hypothetical protein IRL76_07195 [Qipengyuania soli]